MRASRARHRPARSRGASYTLLTAAGGLSMPRLGLDVLIYDPQVHYQQV